MELFGKIVNGLKPLHGSSPLKISDQNNNWGGPEQKNALGGGELNLRGGPKILGGAYENSW